MAYVRDAVAEHPTEPSTSEIDPKLAEQRLSRVEAQARALGFAVLTDGRGRVQGFEERLPPMTDLVGQELGERSFYRLYSGVAHSRAWAALPTGLRRIGDRSVTQDLQFVAALHLISSPIGWFARIAWRYVEIMGWDLDALREVLEGEYDRGHASAESRFWRGA